MRYTIHSEKVTLTHLFPAGGSLEDASKLFPSDIVKLVVDFDSMLVFMNTSQLFSTLKSLLITPDSKRDQENDVIFLCAEKRQFGLRLILAE